MAHYIIVDAERDWKDDTKRYLNRCSVCSHQFSGHKHRNVCRICDTTNKEKGNEK